MITKKVYKRSSKEDPPFSKDPDAKVFSMSDAPINPRFRQDWKRSKQLLPTEDYIAGIQAGDRVMLSRAITVVESQQESHLPVAKAIVEACLPLSGRSFRMGITGAPGAGKSTLIEQLGQQLIQQGHQVAILAVDPSSQLSRGSILGDKTRMAGLSTHPNAFIRPSPAGQSLGGVAQKTRETMHLCEAAGYDMILIETVGVGQSEIAVHSMVDLFLLLLLPGAGDELQGIKRGIVEMADLIAVNKADGDRVRAAQKAKQAYNNALHLFPPKSNGWSPAALTCSALENTGLDDLLQSINRFRELTYSNGAFDKNRYGQARYWLYQTIDDHLRKLFFAHPEVQNHLPELEQAVLDNHRSPFEAAETLIRLFAPKP